MSFRRVFAVRGTRVETPQQDSVLVHVRSLRTVSFLQVVFVRMQRLWRVVGLLGLGLCVGCDGGDAIGTVDATGTVNLDGQPIDGAMITLMPLEGVQGRGGYGLSDGSGKVEFRITPETAGVPAGKYRVLAQKMTMPDGSPVPPDTLAADVEIRNNLSPVYSDPETSPLEVTIPEAGAQDIVVELVSRPSPRPR